MRGQVGLMISKDSRSDVAQIHCVENSKLTYLYQLFSKISVKILYQNIRYHEKSESKFLVFHICAIIT